MSFSSDFLAEVRDIAGILDCDAIEEVASSIASVRDRGGRLFILGVGGSAANASHAVNDFRKIAGLEAYAPTDNVSELTARTNDEGWSTVFESWLRVSRLQPRDGILILSVGGGSLQQQVSPNLVAALEYAKAIGAKILGIVGRDGGHTAKLADACVLIPTVNTAHITPHVEAFQAVVWHLLVFHPALKHAETRWESLPGAAAVRRAVFLDRDGVLTRAVIRDGKPYPPASLAELELEPDAAEALNRLKQQGLLLLVVTNQPDVARGKQQLSTIEEMHRFLKQHLPLDDIFACYHDDSDRCDCRKPAPGLLLRAASKHGVTLAASYMVGDRWRDIDAGAHAGTRTVWIDRHYAERGPTSTPAARVGSAAEAAEWILRDLHNYSYAADLRPETQAVR
jgi:D-sedoheptulose 7-phosphate isomerase